MEGRMLWIFAINAGGQVTVPPFDVGDNIGEAREAAQRMADGLPAGRTVILTTGNPCYTSSATLERFAGARA
jgi:hypothetical protein